MVEIIAGPVDVGGGVTVVVEATGVVVALIVEVATGIVVVATGDVAAGAGCFKTMLDIYAAIRIIMTITMIRPVCDVLFCFICLFYTI